MSFSVFLFFFSMCVSAHRHLHAFVMGWKYLCGPFDIVEFSRISGVSLATRSLSRSQTRLHLWLMFTRRRSTTGVLILGASSHCKPPRLLTGLIHKVFVFFFYSSSKKWLLLSSYDTPQPPPPPPPPPPPIPVKQLGSRLTVFAGHSETITYLIFTVMMSILLLWVLVSQRVHLDALLTAERRRDLDQGAILRHIA